MIAWSRLSLLSKVSFVGVLLLLFGVGVAVRLAVTQQEVRSRASVAYINMLKNGSFETTGSNWIDPWWFGVRSGASGSVSHDSSVKQDGYYSARVNVTQAPSYPEENAWKVQIGQPISFSSGKQYMLTFWARANANKKMGVTIQQNYGNYNEYKDQVFNLTTSWQEFTMLFTPSTSDGNAIVVFNVAYATGTYWLDNVSFGEGYVVPTVTKTPTPTYVAVSPTSIPLPTPTVAYVPTLTPMPLATNTSYPPTPTSTPVDVPTNTPMPPTLTPMPLATNTPYPTVTPIFGNTYIELDLLLHGIGNGGDTVNPTGTGNMNPLHTQRNVGVQVLNSQNSVVANVQGLVNYDMLSGSFKGSVDLGGSFQTGAYLVKVKGDQYLRVQIGGIQNITAGKTNVLSRTVLVTGDVNGDNQINILDYNILMGCYSDLLPAVSCNAGDNLLADLTDDGSVNQFDYNLFLRELLNKAGQ